MAYYKELTAKPIRQMITSRKWTELIESLSENNLIASGGDFADKLSEIEERWEQLEIEVEILGVAIEAYDNYIEGGDGSAEVNYTITDVLESL